MNDIFGNKIDTASLLKRRQATSLFGAGRMCPAKELVNDAWGEMSQADLNEITDLMHHAHQMGEKPDYLRIGQIVANTIAAYAERCLEAAA